MKLPDAYQLQFVAFFTLLCIVAACRDGNSPWFVLAVAVGSWLVWFTLAFIGRNWL